ncbi:protein outspread [Onthophagus taurus]|uniref:protein outspread n=1 Tax=Onthophagus taurus TaxID=166361 RepID=UPI0039BDE9F8
MSQCKKFAPNIFHKTKCSNCFRQKEEHSAEALECNRASRSIARSGYLFVAPDWDFSVPLNRTKRWQRRWFVLYDDGELNYSVDEHPDTVPQGSVDMSKVLEVTGAEQITGHPHSLALTGPDRVTFVKAASREDARWWAELLAVFPRRHKRNATFPGGRASPSLPQLGRSASPQPPRPRHLSCTGPSPRTNFTTPPLKEERESPSKEDASRPVWLPEPTNTLTIDTTPPPRTDYVVTSGSPPTRDKLRCEEKAKTRRDWRHERLRDIATALTDRSPESSLALPAEGLLNLKKGWLWYKEKGTDNEWLRRWWVLCGPTLIAYCDQDEQGTPELTIELSSVTDCTEVLTDTRYGFQIQWSGHTLILAAVTSGIRSNWLQSLKKATPMTLSVESPVSTPATPRSALFSSDEEYRTASEGGRRDSGDWGDLPPSPPLSRTALAKVKERTRIRPKLPRSQSRQSTIDSVSTDELDGFKEPDEVDYKNMINKQTVEVDGLRKQLSNALSEIQHLESELTRYKKIQMESVVREKQEKEIIQNLEKSERELNQKLNQLEERHLKEQNGLHNRLIEIESIATENEEKYLYTSKELQTNQKLVCSLQEELKLLNDRHAKNRQENDKLYKKLQEMECKPHTRRKRLDSLTDLTDINLDMDLDNLNHNELIEQCLDLRSRFEKAVVEIRVLKRELRESHVKYDHLELQNMGLKKSIEMAEQEAQAQSALMADRVQDLTAKLATVERQARTLKSKLQDSREKRRSLSLKGRENFSINKEVEDKITELEAKIMTIERDKWRRKHRRERSSERGSPIDDRSLRRIRRKSLDSATSSEPMKLLMRLSNLEGKVSGVTTSNESINTSSGVFGQSEKQDDKNLCCESIITAANEKLNDCKNVLGSIKLSGGEKLMNLETNLCELGEILGRTINENEFNVVKLSAGSVVKQLECLLREKLKSLYEKRRILQESNELNDQTRIELLAEKLAYENLIIERIQQAVQMSTLDDNYSERLLNKEAIETTNLLHSLRSKLNGSGKKQPPIYKTSMDYLTKVLTRRLLITQHKYHFTRTNKITNFNQFIKLLEEEQSKINNLLNNYKSNKLPQLSEALAIETINLATDQTCHIKSFDKDLINDMWKAAKEIVNTELIQSEINHTLMRTAQLYEEQSSSDQSNFFSFYAYERAALELWSDSVESRLRVEMDKNIEELTENYKQSLQKLQRQNWRRRLESERSTINVNTLLNEYADIIAHKSLIDARISVLKSEFSFQNENHNAGNTIQENLIEYLQNDKAFDFGEESNIKSIASLEAEFRCLFQQYSMECSDSLARMDLMDARSALQDLSKEVFELACFCSCGKYEEKIEIYNIQDVCRKCVELRGRLNEIKQVIYEIKRTRRSDDEDRKPLYLGTEYLNQVENLRAAYRRTLTECENHKQQADLEQLQFLCEQVLVAMEHWHRRTLQDLREQHSRELQALKQDKEQALAEETQATLAALDAMRKAHEAEVQREVARFKQDFAREQQDELLELTERLSVKCLEAAALEEQLGSATRQLAHAQQHILQLERNPQLSLQN